MSGRPTSAQGAPSLRVEILKELQLLIDNREARDRVDRGPLAEARGKEHWVLHLLLRGLESQQAHMDTLVGSAYGNLTARLQAIEDRVARTEEMTQALEADLKTRFEQSESSAAERIDKGLQAGVDRLASSLTSQVNENLDRKWKPVGESIETFAQGSRQVLKDVADTYRVATQTRLLLNENSRRMTDLGRDLVSLEESLKLVLSKTIEDTLAPLEARVAALEGEGHVPEGGAPPSTGSSPKPTEPATGK